jgi:hypothetical protein
MQFGAGSLRAPVEDVVDLDVADFWAGVLVVDLVTALVVAAGPSAAADGELALPPQAARLPASTVTGTSNQLDFMGPRCSSGPST